MVKLKILTGSSRPGRFNIQPATWIYEIAQQQKEVAAELIDLAELNLPFLDEPVPPSQHQYSKEHTRRWAARIAEAEAFIFVTPEYNHSYSPILKNAIDYLFVEWHYKPVAFISYGSLAGGSRAVEHLRGVAAEIKMYDLREQILLPNYRRQMDTTGQYQFDEHQIEAAQQMIKELAFWGEKMREAREMLAERSK